MTRPPARVSPSPVVHEPAALILAAEASTDDLGRQREIGLALARLTRPWHPVATACLERCLPAFPDDPEVLYLFALGAWVRDQRDPSRRAALEAARRAALLSGAPAAFRQLAQCALSCREWQEAFLAGRASEPSGRSPQQAVARAFLLGRPEVSFQRLGQELTFTLSTATTQTIEAACHHVQGVLTEEPELRFLVGWLERCAHFVEVGILVGNHTSFLLRSFRPARADLLEADPLMLPVIRANIARNNPAGTEISIRNRLVGRGPAGPASFAGAEVTTASLDELILGRPDFLKIDVDGAELEVLDGALRLLREVRPRLMIEVTAETRAPTLERLGTLGYRLSSAIGHESYENLFLDP